MTRLAIQENSIVAKKLLANYIEAMKTQNLNETIIHDIKTLNNT